MLGSRDVSYNNRELLDHLSDALASNVSRRFLNDKVDVYLVWKGNTASITKWKTSFCPLLDNKDRVQQVLQANVGRYVIEVIAEIRIIFEKIKSGIKKSTWLIDYILQLFPPQPPFILNPEVNEYINVLGYAEVRTDTVMFLKQEMYQNVKFEVLLQILILGNHTYAYPP